jgi:hypothetical protein
MFRDDKEFVPLQAADLAAWLQRNKAASTLHKFAWVSEVVGENLRTSPFSQTFSREYYLAALPLLKGRTFAKEALREPPK